MTLKAGCLQVHGVGRGGRWRHANRRQPRGESVTPDERQPIGSGADHFETRIRSADGVRLNLLRLGSAYRLDLDEASAMQEALADSNIDILDMDAGESESDVRPHQIVDPLRLATELCNDGLALLRIELSDATLEALRECKRSGRSTAFLQLTLVNDLDSLKRPPDRDPHHASLQARRPLAGRFGDQPSLVERIAALGEEIGGAWIDPRRLVEVAADKLVFELAGYQLARYLIGRIGRRRDKLRRRSGVAAGGLKRIVRDGNRIARNLHRARRARAGRIAESCGIEDNRASALLSVLNTTPYSRLPLVLFADLLELVAAARARQVLGRESRMRLTALR